MPWDELELRSPFRVWLERTCTVQPGCCHPPPGPQHLCTRITEPVGGKLNSPTWDTCKQAVLTSYMSGYLSLSVRYCTWEVVSYHLRLEYNLPSKRILFASDRWLRTAAILDYPSSGWQPGRCRKEGPYDAVALPGGNLHSTHASLLLRRPSWRSTWQETPRPEHLCSFHGSVGHEIALGTKTLTG